MEKRREIRFFALPESLNYKPRYGQEVYNELIAYLSPEDIKKLDSQLEGIEVDKGIAQKINQGNWETLFREHFNQFPEQALLCLKHGFISDLSYSTSQLFFNTWIWEKNRSNNAMKFISVLNDENQRTRNADAMIDATMKIISTSYKKWKIKDKHFEIDKMAEKEVIEALSHIYIEAFLNICFFNGGNKSLDASSWTDTQKRNFYIQCVHTEENAEIEVISAIQDDALLQKVKQYVKDKYVQHLGQYGI